MDFNKESYIARFVKSPTECCPSKAKESAILQSKVDDFVASGGVIQLPKFGESGAVYRGRKEEKEFRLGQMKNGQL